MTDERHAPAAMRVLDIDEMEFSEISSLLQRVGYGHLACAKENQPYVVPIHYVYDPPHILIYTTKGKKTDFLASNPEVCLQVEEVRGARDWTSAIVAGRAQLLTDPDKREKAIQLLTLLNPTLTPAISRISHAGSVRQNVVEIFQITLHSMSGRKTRNTASLE
jgi:nitroimidazol reductase NimA-like FMN-containing flavoprotein (pyridoxamine 5'-phosphate oxidase superfamily)